MPRSETFKCSGVECPLLQIEGLEDKHSALLIACQKTSRIPGGDLAIYPEKKKAMAESNSYKIECLRPECQADPKQIILSVPRLLIVQPMKLLPRISKNWRVSKKAK
jgi:hypothetical protein